MLPKSIPHAAFRKQRQFPECARHRALRCPDAKVRENIRRWSSVRCSGRGRPHSASLPKSAAGGCVQLGSTAAPGCGWPRPRGKLRADAREVPYLVPMPRRVSDGGVADCARGRARSPIQFRTPHVAFRNQRLTGSAGKWRGNLRSSEG